MGDFVGLDKNVNPCNHDPEGFVFGVVNGGTTKTQEITIPDLVGKSSFILALNLPGTNKAHYHNANYSDNFSIAYLEYYNGKFFGFGLENQCTISLDPSKYTFDTKTGKVACTSGTNLFYLFNMSVGYRYMTW